MELHHEPVLDAHRCHLHEDLSAKELLAAVVERPCQRTGEQRRSRLAVERRGECGRRPVIGRGGAERACELTALEERSQILVPLRRVATGQLAECGDVLDEAFVVGIRDGVGSERRDDPAGETIVAQAPMMAQAAEWRVGGGDDVDAEPVEQGTRPELVAAEAVVDAVEDVVGGLLGEADRHAEDLVQDVVHPQP